MDYGHDLLFGTFISPANRPAGAPVELAALADRAGLDLATFQDHPYQPGFHDTWTLMSYIAARTERISLTANVLNLPLRQPVVVARAAASLDLLTGGRVELGLGAGAFWDAIEAAGGRRLSPAQSVVALAEAIDVIRGVWDAQRAGGVRVEGDFYRVVGAKRGPAPAHDIGIWLGAYKPRMLHLTGHVADGWLPSLAYLPGGPTDLAASNAQVDEGAKAAGRDPRAVRRLLNIAGRFSSSSNGFLDGPPDQWVEELAGLTLEYGISGFILGTDDPAMVERYAYEIAPAVREMVQAERSDSGRPPKSPSPVRPVDTTPPGSTVFATTPTPDDGARRSGATLWDESTRPVGPPAPEGHVYSPRAQAVGHHLVDVHDNLRQELANVRDVIGQVIQGTLAVGDARSMINMMTLRQNDWTLGAYCASYCRVVTQHHALEDAQIFPHLRRSDADLAPVIDRLEAEHLVIHEVLEGVDTALVRIIGRSGQPDDLTELQEAVDVLTDTLLSHLSYEEREILEPLARHGFFPGQI
ncbi:LLM class flavin-dependent oxidoreductase [Frankia tisae]|uniref:LLM class flavin-dependent oxidoreductase n=1 Tax=Frankia tisae TaxID=2950104 RepID=UPI0021C08136|nr:LLM class flavin-dependent oxidoreductase [Frankia tisae]